MAVKELITGAPLASLLWLAPLSIGCGHGAGTAPAQTNTEGYPASAAAVESRVATPPPAPTPVAAHPAAISAPPSSAPAQATVVAPPATLSLPQRAYEPPMPLELGRSTSVLQPVPAASNGPPTTATGLRFVVRGVDPLDVLYIRSGPGASHDVVGTIPPDGSGVLPVGGRRQMGPSVWREVSYRGVRGWVNERFLVEARANQPR